MKKILFIFVCTLIIGTTSAQDIILKKNADEIPAKILKVGNTEIEYKKWNNLDGPTYTIATNDIFIIKYQNGSKDIISANSTRTRSKITGNFPKYQGERHTDSAWARFPNSSTRTVFSSKPYTAYASTPIYSLVWALGSTIFTNP